MKIAECTVTTRCPLDKYSNTNKQYDIEYMEDGGFYIYDEEPSKRRGRIGYAVKWTAPVDLEAIPYGSYVRIKGNPVEIEPHTYEYTAEIHVSKKQYTAEIKSEAERRMSDEKLMRLDK